MPPLVLDDDEAVTIALALRAAASSAPPSLADAALSALTKLDQVLPVVLRERVAALQAVTVSGPASGGPEIEPDVLTALALGCRRAERVRFTYRSGEGAVSDRHVEPYRLVPLQRRWYLVAFDRDRAEWRTFRVDRITDVRSTGAAFVAIDPPDAFAMVTEGVAVRAYAEQATVRIHHPPAEVAQRVPPDVGVQVDADESSTVVVIGGDMPWIARYLVGLDCPFEVVAPDALRSALRSLARQLLRDHAAVRARPPD